MEHPANLMGCRLLYRWELKCDAESAGNFKTLGLTVQSGPSDQLGGVWKMGLTRRPLKKGLRNSAGLAETIIEKAKVHADCRT